MPDTRFSRFTKIGLAMLLTLAATPAVLFVPAARAQYTDRHAIDDLGGPSAFAERRAALAKELKTGFTLLFARNEIPEASHYREDNDFYYFTGLQDPGAVLMIDNSDGTITLFEPQQSGPHRASLWREPLIASPNRTRQAGLFESDSGV
jgi:Aminopeptidase P, N-terminal domain